jgi:hypothetical protein
MTAILEFKDSPSKISESVVNRGFHSLKMWNRYGIGLESIFAEIIQIIFAKFS